MGQAHQREFFAQTDTVEGFKPQTLTNATEVNGAGFDVIEHAAAKAVCSLAFTTASGAAGDKYVLKIEAESSDDVAFGAVTALKEYEHTITTDASNGAQSAVVMLPTKLLAAKRYCRFNVTFTADGDNTGTASSISASLSVELGGNLSDPQDAYDRDGYGKVNIVE